MRATARLSSVPSWGRETTRLPRSQRGPPHNLVESSEHHLPRSVEPRGVRILLRPQAFRSGSQSCTVLCRPMRHRGTRIGRSAGLDRGEKLTAHEESYPHVWGVINSLTKWLVSGAAFCALVWRHDVYVAWCLLCSIFSVISCKVLKKLINHDRPDNSPQKPDPGMPSSHANSLAYLAVYVAISVVGSWGHTGISRLVASSVVMLAMFLTWMRVKCNFHSVPQVVVGFLLGSTQAIVWNHIGQTWVLPLAASGHQGLQWSIYAMCGVFVAGFAYVNLRDKLGERMEMGRDV